MKIYLVLNGYAYEGWDLTGAVAHGTLESAVETREALAAFDVERYGTSDWKVVEVEYKP